MTRFRAHVGWCFGLSQLREYTLYHFLHRWQTAHCTNPCLANSLMSSTMGLHLLSIQHVPQNSDYNALHPHKYILENASPNICLSLSRGNHKNSLFLNHPRPRIPPLHACLPSAVPRQEWGRSGRRARDEFPSAGASRSLYCVL